MKNRKKKKQRRNIETTGQKYNGLPYYIGQTIKKSDLLRVLELRFRLGCLCARYGSRFCARNISIHGSRPSVTLDSSLSV